MTASEFTLASDHIDGYDGRVPNFMIAGEQKAGTSYLHLNLRHHPQVFMTRVIRYHQQFHAAGSHHVANLANECAAVYFNHATRQFPIVKLIL